MLKTYFTTLDQVNEHLTADISTDLDVMLPYLNQAKKYAIEIIGSPLHNLLIDYIHQVVEGEEEPIVDEVYDALIEKVRPVVANFGYYMAVPKLNINVGATGFTIITGSNLEPASQWRVDEFRKSVEIAGYDAQEDLIAFLEENITDYPDWEFSTAFSFNKNLFVNNATEFYQTILHDITRINFIRIKHHILMSENTQIKTSIGKDLFDEIKSQILLSDITDLNDALLKDFIKPAVCYLAYNKLSPDETFLNEGNRIIKELRNYLNENATDYPLYLASSLYEELTDEEYNSEESGIFFSK
jgi:hypothetical protein